MQGGGIQSTKVCSKNIGQHQNQSKIRIFRIGAHRALSSRPLVRETQVAVNDGKRRGIAPKKAEQPRLQLKIMWLNHMHHALTGRRL
jgi:hypothetical protein